MTPPKKPHRNDERVVKCPVEGCDAEKLARGIHLHVRRTSDEAHGPQGEVPDGLNFENLEEVGTKEVEVNYPEHRDVETVARQCPYCQQVFRGQQGVFIHLGQVAGRKNHPPNASEIHEAEDFPVVELDDDENIISVVEYAPIASTESTLSIEPIEAERVYRYIADLLAEQKPEEAGRARDSLLSRK